MVIRARFKDGVAVPESIVNVPDGTEVGIIFPEPKANAVEEITPEIRDEFKFWDDLSTNAWQKFLEWEQEANQRPGPGLCREMVSIVADDEEHLEDFAEHMP